MPERSSTQLKKNPRGFSPQLVKVRPKMPTKGWLIASKNSQNYQPGPSMWRYGRWFRTGLALFWLLSAAFLLSSCTATAYSPKLARDYFESEAPLNQIALENTALSAEELPKMQVRQLWAGNKEKLVWLDFHSEKLCGQAGCAYSLYLVEAGNPQLKRVWWGYLNPRLPPKISLLEVNPLNVKGQAYPCLTINQLESPKSEDVRQTTLCWDAGQYQVFSTQLISH